MGFNIRGGDKSSLALLSSKRGRAYARTRADEAFALPDFSDAMPISTAEPQRQSNSIRPEQPVENDAENVKQTMMEHESVFKEQLHELHRLYQKQCMLMAESNKGPAGDRAPEPPSSNSSFLCIPETLKLQGERNFGGASSTKVCKNKQSYRALLGMDDVKRIEDCELSGQQGCHRPFEVCGSSLKQGSSQLIDLEQPLAKRPIIDLERPAEEYMDVEVQEEKPQIASLMYKSADMLASGHNSHFLGSHYQAEEKRELPFGASRDVRDNKLMGFQIINDSRISGRSPGSGEEMPKGFLQHKEHASIQLTLNEVRSFPPGPVTSPNCPKAEPSSYPKEALSASVLFRGLPDLNGDANFIEQQASPMQVLAEENAKDRQCVDLEVNSRSYSSASKLPHWLCQGPTVGPSPSHVSAQNSAWQQPRTSVFLPQVHDRTMKTSFFRPQAHEKTNWRSNLPMEMTRASSTEEPNFAWSQNIACLEEREVSFRDPLSACSPQLFRGANPGVAEGLYPGVHGRDYIRGAIPFFSSQARENDNVGIHTSATSFHSVMGHQGRAFETCDLSAELPLRVSSEGPMIFQTLSPWYQQRESFSSLLQQASNPEPFSSRSPPVSSVNLWETGFTYQGPPFGVDCPDRALYGLHTHVRNTDGSSSRPVNTTASPALDIMNACSEFGRTIHGRMNGSEITPYTHFRNTEGSSSRLVSSTASPALDLVNAGSELRRITDASVKGSEVIPYKQVETPYFMTQAPAVSSSDNHHPELNSRKPLFDLNVSSEDNMPEGNIDFHDVIYTSCDATQPQSFKQESEMNRSAGWGTLNGIQAPLLYEPQRESSCFVDRVAAQGTAFEVPFDINATHLHNEASYLSKAGDLQCTEGDLLRKDICADWCSGEDETGGGFMGVKSSDGSGLTSCESRDGVHLEFIKARDDSNTSSGEACHSFESRIPNRKEDPSSLQRTTSVVDAFSGDQFGSLNRQIIPSHYDPKRDCLSYNYTEFGDESEAACVFAKKDLVEASEAAELLLSLGLDLPSLAGDEDAIDDCENCLAWLADIIPHEDNSKPEDMSIKVAFIEKHTEQAFGVTSEKTLDSFELAVLALKPVDPNLESPATPSPDRGNVIENVPILRRRPSRRGRGGKDFQKEMLRSMSSLSRHEVTEDLQFIEGLMKSTAEATNSSSPSPDDKPLSRPEQGFSKSIGKGKVTKSCTARKVCSWGESTRRKRLGRQRSQWLCLPPGVRTSLFSNNAADVAS